MTKQECAIVMARTGVCMLEGDDLKYYYDYVGELLGRPVYTHEYLLMIDEIKKRSQKDFIDLCKKAV